MEPSGAQWDIPGAHQPPPTDDHREHDWEPVARYHFVTSFDVAASPQRAWEVLSDLSAWPSWWRWLEGTQLLAQGDRDGVGSSYRCSFRTALPYTLTFDAEVVAATPPVRIEIRASGELTGAGVWELLGARGGCRLRYTWVVATTKAWMNLLAPLARPAFAWNHDVLMRDFATGFASQLGVAASTVDTHAVEPGSPGFGVLPRPAAS